MNTALIDGRFSSGAPLSERAITKSYAVCSRYAGLLRNAPDYGFGELSSEPAADLDKLKIRADSLSAAGVSESSLRVFQTGNLEPFGGYASFLDEKTVLVIENSGASYRITAPKIFISTGTHSQIPPIEGLYGTGYFGPETLWQMEQIPRHLIVIGGGYIGVETAQQFRRFGSEVTILQKNKRLLAKEDWDFSDAIRSLLIDEGISIKTGCRVISAARTALNDLRQPDPIRVIFHDEAGEHQVEGTHLFVAAGRAPNTGTLNLAAGSIETDARGFIEVNDRLETSTHGIWALGDVTGSPSFANLSFDDYRIVSDNLFKGGTRTRRGRLFSTALRTDPCLASVGLRESDLKGDEPYRVLKKDTGVLQFAKDEGETRGFMKAIVQEKSGRLMGFGMFGPSAGELVGAAHLAIMGGLSAEDLSWGLYPFPGAMEVFNELFSL